MCAKRLPHFAPIQSIARFGCAACALRFTIIGAHKMDRREQLGAELSALETQISSWCAASAWPGKMPTPPFAAWDRRKEIYEELRALGVRCPQYEHMRWRDKQKAQNA